MIASPSEPGRSASFASLAATVLPARPLHLAIGMFDGVHLGHRAVVEAAVHSARAERGLAAALTFDPHPSRLLRPENPVRLIMSPQIRARHLLECGLDAVITEPFRPELAALEAEEFLPLLRRHLSSLAAIYVGENWRFGRERRGDVNLLNQQARQWRLAVVSAPRINHNGEAISSTRIRERLEAGDIHEVNTLLGRAYGSEGVVRPGKRLGRTIGFPTLNLPWEPECRPRYGVYAVRLGRVGTAEGLPAVANYGLRPTVENVVAPRLEVHVLGACPYEEGHALAVEWLEFLRPEQRFADLAALRTQIAADVEQARRYHALSP